MTCIDLDSIWPTMAHFGGGGGYACNVVFSQEMEFLPQRRYDGDRKIKTFSCAEQMRVMAFAQLTIDLPTTALEAFNEHRKQILAEGLADLSKPAGKAVIICSTDR